MKSTTALVSIIVPVYQVEMYLQKCINSICTQTYTQLEIILVNDGSPDNCGVICDRNAMNDSRIRVLHKKNEGLSSARNAGLDIATGEYIAFVDSDDVIHPRFIEILVELCTRYECDIAQCDFYAVAEDSLYLPLNSPQFVKIYDRKEALHELCCGNNGVKYTVAWNKIYKKKLFEKIRYPYGRIHEDEFTTYRLLWETKRVAVTNQYLYYYLQRSTSIMGMEFSIRRLDALDALRERRNFLKQKGLEDDYMGTQRKLLIQIRNSYIQLKKSVPDSHLLCEQLLAEKTELEQLLAFCPEKKEIKIYNKVQEDCYFQESARIVLYGAGEIGKICYQWIKKHGNGMIVGWVDNFWYLHTKESYPVSPLDALQSLIYDYVLITVKNREMQEDIKRNLISWGISKEKIRSISI